MNDAEHLYPKRNVCPRCGEWEIALGDVFCGFCGLKFEDFDVKLSPNKIVVVGESLPILLKIKNMRSHIAKVTDIEFSVKDVIEFADQDGVLLPISIDPGSEVNINLNAKLVPVDNDHITKIDVFIYSDVQAGVIKREIIFYPPPLIDIEPCEDVFEFTLDDDEKQCHELDVILKRGLIEIDNVISDASWINLIPDCDYSEENPIALDEVEGPKSQRCTLQISKNQVENIFAEKFQDGEAVATFSFLRNAETVLEKQFNIKVIVPPILSIINAKKLVKEKNVELDDGDCDAIFELREEVWIGGRLEKINIPFGVENKGGSSLQMSSWVIEDELKSNLLSLDFLPALLDPGHSTLNDTNLIISLNKIEEGENVISVDLYSNHNGKANSKIRVDIHLNAIIMPEFRGVVAFDFGTTNSCCVVFDQRKDRKFAGTPILPIDWYQERYNRDLLYSQDEYSGKIEFLGNNGSAPSIVIYQKKEVEESSEKRQYVIGNSAYVVLGTADGRATWMSIKNKLGIEDRFHVYFDDDIEANPNSADYSELLPEDISADIIKIFLGRIEYLLKAKISECYISHPVGFVRARLEALKCSFENAGIKTITDDKLWPEPVCAAYHFISNVLLEEYLEKKESREEYILVYDFGGGTTDISYMKINFNCVESKKPKLSTEIIGQDGHRKYGGDNITEEVVKDFIEQIKTLEDCKNVPILRPLHRYEHRSEEEIKLGVKNYYELWRFAESAKKSISDGKDKYEASIELSGFEGKRPLADVVIMNEKINQIVEKGVLVTIQIIKNLLIRAAQKTNFYNPNYILLSGNSCRMPLVKKMIKDHFNESEIRFPIKDDVIDENDVPPEDYVYKESVALGLCKLATNTKGPTEFSIRKPKQISCSLVDLGIIYFRGNKEKFASVIKKGDPLDEWKKAGKQLVYKKGETVTIVERIAPETCDVSFDDIYEDVAEYQLSSDKLQNFTDEDFENAELYIKLTSHQELEMKLETSSGKSEILDKFEIPIRPY